MRDIDTAYGLAEKSMGKFMPAAQFIVDTYVTSPSGETEAIVLCAALDMATGSELTKYKYIAIGAGLTILTIVTIKVIRKLN